MKKNFATILSLAFFAVSQASADTIDTFSFNSFAVSPANIITGILSIDTTTNTIIADSTVIQLPLYGMTSLFAVGESAKLIQNTSTWLQINESTTTSKATFSVSVFGGVGTLAAPVETIISYSPSIGSGWNQLNASTTGSITSAVPESQEWAMMLLGLPVIGWVVRRKQSAMQKVSA
jgi:hypothetical protein